MQKVTISLYKPQSRTENHSYLLQWQQRWAGLPQPLIKHLHCSLGHPGTHLSSPPEIFPEILKDYHKLVLAFQCYVKFHHPNKILFIYNPCMIGPNQVLSTKRVPFLSQQHIEIPLRLLPVLKGYFRLSS
jgi:hypothetical protein